MKQEAISKCLLVAALALSAPTFAASSPRDIDGLLRDADALRSTSPKALGPMLSKLDSLQTNASPEQQRHLRLLHAYHKIAIGQYEAAVKEAVSVHDEATEAPIKFRAALLVANGAAITRDFSLGLRYLERALELTDQIPDRDQRHQAFLVAAVLYNQYGQFSLGQLYAERVLAQETSERNICFAKQLRAESAFGLGVPLSDREINSAISECADQREVIASNLLRGYLARHWVSSGKTAQAIDLLESHLPEIEATGYPRLVGEIHGLLAEYRLMSGDLDGAEGHARRALNNGGKDAYSLPLVTAHRVLYEAALKRGNLKTALDEYRQYAEADKARLDEVKAREFAFQLSRHELQQKNQAIELLSRQNEVLRLQQEVSKTSAQNNQLLVAMLLLVLGVGAYWAYKIKRVQMMFRKQAQMDSLTGISNRGFFRAEAEVHLGRCKASNKEAALVLLDLDNFKHINDRYGHASGDWVLKQVATACRAACREGDLFGRLGGEEFAILSCGGDLHTAERIAQQCRAALAAIDTSSIGHEHAITASFGCATTRLSGHVFENLFMHADRAMYRAKAEGRDRVCAHEDNRPVLVRTQAQAHA
ncbi:sensor domain-containing diguanylate cyclase [Lysobacter tyrosinilyticus]